METEIKLSPVLPRVGDRIFNDPQIAPHLSLPARIQMDTTYYDTPDGALDKHRYTLRLRLENGQAVCCLKGPAAGPNARLELETPAQTVEAGLHKLLSDPFFPAEAVPLLEGQPLSPTCGARFLRRQAKYSRDRLSFFLSYDRGELHCGDRRAPLSEVELELIEGGYDELADLCLDLCEHYALSVCGDSKHKRAKALGGQGRDARPVDTGLLQKQLIGYCVHAGFLEYEVGGAGQIRYYLTPLGERELPRLFGVDPQGFEPHV